MTETSPKLPAHAHSQARENFSEELQEIQQSKDRLVMVLSEGERESRNIQIRSENVKQEPTGQSGVKLPTSNAQPVKLSKPERADSMPGRSAAQDIPALHGKDEKTVVQNRSETTSTSSTHSQRPGTFQFSEKAIVTPTPTEKPNVQHILTEKPSVLHTPTEKSGGSHTPTEKPSAPHILTEKPSVEHIQTEKQSVLCTATENSVAQHTPTENPTVEHIPTERPSALHTATEKPTVLHIPTEKPSVSRTATEKSVASHTPTEKPTVEHFPTQKPSVLHTETEKSVAPHTPTEKTVVPHTPTEKPTVEHIPAEKRTTTGKSIAPHFSTEKTNPPHTVTEKPTVEHIPTEKPSVIHTATEKPTIPHTLTDKPSAPYTSAKKLSSSSSQLPLVTVTHTKTAPQAARVHDLRGDRLEISIPEEVTEVHLHSEHSESVGQKLSVEKPVLSQMSNKVSVDGTKQDMFVTQQQKDVDSQRAQTPSQEPGSTPQFAGNILKEASVLADKSGPKVPETGKNASRTSASKRKKVTYWFFVHTLCSVTNVSR
jgi:hypothetical protein